MKHFKIFSFANKTNLIIRFAIAMVLIVSTAAKSQEIQDTKEVWNKMESIIKNVKPVTFRNKTYNIIKYGAKSDGTFDNTQAIKSN